MVSEIASRETWIAVARLLRLERHAREVQRRAHHLQGLRDFQLGVGSGCARVLLAPLLLASTRSQFRQSRGPRGAVQGAGVLGQPGRRRVPPRCHSVSLRARGHDVREPA